MSDRCPLGYLFIELLISHSKIYSHLYNESLRTRIVLSLINKLFLFSVCEVSSKSEIILCKYRKLNIARIFMTGVFKLNAFIMQHLTSRLVFTVSHELVGRFQPDLHRYNIGT